MNIILGPPGTGKTTTLINIMEEKLKNGVDPHRIGFVSFTRKGAYEARDRVISKFGFYKNELPYFRTLHSMAYRILGISKNEVMEIEHWRELGNILGIGFTGLFNPEDVPDEDDRKGDRMLFLDSYSRNTMRDLKSIWNNYGEGINWEELDLVKRTLEKFKEKNGLIDFTDMIEKFISKNQIIPVDVVFVDEAQDNSTLQWEMIKVAFRDVKEIYIGGDDDQSVYKWAGADVKTFLNLKGDIRVLKKSYRLPLNVFKIASKISNMIINRHKKVFSPRDDQGNIYYHNFVDYIDFKEPGSWLCLARNRYLLNELESVVRARGLSYSTKWGNSIRKNHIKAIYAWERMRKGEFVDRKDAEIAVKYSGSIIKGNKDPIKFNDIRSRDIPWHEAFFRMSKKDIEYYRAVLRNGGNLKEKPNIHLNTIHSVKGGEADNVVIVSDISRKSYKNLQEYPDDEHRVFYVGVTRTRNNLHIIMPQTEFFYNIPRI